MKQIQIEFQPGVTQMFSDLMEAVRHVVYSGRFKQAEFAAALDVSPSKLTRKLGGDLNTTVKDLEAILDFSGDLTPIYYLIEKYVQSGGKPLKNEIALKKVGKLMAELQKTMAALEHGE